MKALSEI